MSSSPSCPRCESPVVAFSIPDPLRERVLDGAPAASICTGCLLLEPLDRTEPVDSAPVEFDPLPFPDGEGGAATALAVGLLDSLALNRRGIEACVEHAERHGADVFLVLDRLVDADVNPSFDPARRKAQLENLL